MYGRQIYYILVLLALVITLIFVLNFYFINRLNYEYNISNSYGNKLIHINGDNSRNLPTSLEKLIKTRAKKLKSVYKNVNPRFSTVANELLSNFKTQNYENVTDIWRLGKSWPRNNEIYPRNTPKLGSIIKALQTEEIIKVINSPKGTQLKLLFKLGGAQYVLLKPKWYQRDALIVGNVYSGKDRHNSEIIGFHLGLLLDLRWTPIAVGRKISMGEIYKKADEELKSTMLKNGTQDCVFGKCFYCNEKEFVCGEDENGVTEGVLLFIIPGKIMKHRSPWQRTYKNNVRAEWEDDDEYCEDVKQKLTETRILDLIDAAIFDFLIQNGDRHHYETRNDRLLLLDNGKGFGNPAIDHLDILAPLYQCCLIRKSTWERLLLFSGGKLTETLRELNKIDLLYPLLTEQHYIAIERRLLLIYSAFELCKDKFSYSKIIK